MIKLPVNYKVCIYLYKRLYLDAKTYGNDYLVTALFYNIDDNTVLLVDYEKPSYSYSYGPLNNIYKKEFSISELKELFPEKYSKVYIGGDTQL